MAKKCFDARNLYQFAVYSKQALIDGIEIGVVRCGGEAMFDRPSGECKTVVHYDDGDRIVKCVYKGIRIPDIDGTEDCAEVLMYADGKDEWVSLYEMSYDEIVFLVKHLRNLES